MTKQTKKAIDSAFSRRNPREGGGRCFFMKGLKRQLSPGGSIAPSDQALRQRLWGARDVHLAHLEDHAFVDGSEGTS